MNKIKKGDQVIVIAGKGKNATGRVKSVHDKGARVTVEGVNLAKKHVKPNPQQGTEGGIQDQAMPIHISNVALLNPATQKADRVGIKTLEDGKRVRYFKSNGELVDIGK